MNIKIKKGLANGTVSAPPSKSYSHRMIICAALAEGKSVLTGFTDSQDILASLDCVKALGATYELDGNKIVVNGIKPQYLENAVFPCRESGSTLRFFIPISIIAGGKVQFTGSTRLIERGISIYENLLGNKGVEFGKTSDAITVNGTLQPGLYEIPGNISSQFISGLLFSLPLLNGDSTIKIIPPVESYSYIDMTIDVLKEFGVVVEKKSQNEFFIKGNQKYLAHDTAIEGDWSNAASLFAFNSIGGDVTVTGLNNESTQGDKICLEYLKKLESENAMDSEIDISNCPDLGPVLFAVAAINHGGNFTGTYRLRIKECDRATAMQEELAKCGIKVDVLENSVIVHNGELKKPAEIISSHNDHRIVMAMALVATKVEASIEQVESINKSFPTYFDTIKSLGVEVENA